MLLGLIYCYDHLEVVAFTASLSQFVFAVVMLLWTQRGASFQWPLIRAEQLGEKGFGWGNLFGFASMNLFLILPAVVFYVAFCCSLAVDHFSDGFMALHGDRVSVRAKTFSRQDGKTIELVPMAHIGDSAFYEKVSRSFPEQCVILLEGVSDKNNKMTGKLSYRQLASALGLVEQKDEFEAPKAISRNADIDISEFSKEARKSTRLNSSH